MEEQCTLSVIIPAYNAEKSIDQAINSVLSVARTDMELIVVNDGSTDGTLARLNAISDRRLSIFSQANAGVSSARNTGLRHVKGKYVTFVDADDEVIPAQYEKIIDFLRDSDVDAVYTGYEIRDGEHKSYVHTAISDANEKEKLREYMLDFPFAKRKSANYLSARVYQYLIRTEIIARHHLSFPVGIHLAEDLCFCMVMLGHIENLVVWDEKTYIYHVIQGSALHRYRENYLTEICGVYDFLKDHSAGFETQLNRYLYAQCKRAVYVYVRHFLRLKDLKNCIRTVDKLLQHEYIRTSLDGCDFSDWTLFEKAENSAIRGRNAVLLVILTALRAMKNKAERMR